MTGALAAQLKARDRERWLAVLWAPAVARPSLLALHSYDLEQARIVAEAKEPILGEIKLAWWRERLLALAQGVAPPAEPILAALATHAIPRGVDMQALAALEDGLQPLLQDEPLDAEMIASARGGPLFVALAQALAGGAVEQHDADAARAAGARFGLAQLWRGSWGNAAQRIAPFTPPLAGAPIAALPGHLRGLLALAEDDLALIASRKPLAIAATAGRQWRLARAAF